MKHKKCECCNKDIPKRKLNFKIYKTRKYCSRKCFFLGREKIFEEKRFEKLRKEELRKKTLELIKERKQEEFNLLLKKEKLTITELRVKLIKKFGSFSEIAKELGVKEIRAYNLFCCRKIPKEDKTIKRYSKIFGINWKRLKVIFYKAPEDLRDYLEEFSFKQKEFVRGMNLKKLSRQTLTPIIKKELIVHNEIARLPDFERELEIK